MNKRTQCVLLLLLLALTQVTPIYASKGEQYVIKAVYRFDEKPSWATKPLKETSPVEIVNIAKGDTVMSGVTVIVKSQGDYTLKIGGDTMGVTGDGERYYGTWTTSTTGPATIVVTAWSGETKAGEASVDVNVVSTAQWELDIEIDYLVGYEPQQVVLDYLEAYWMGFAIDVNCNKDDPIDGYGSGSISSDTFWSIENIYNEGIDGDSTDDDGDGTSNDYTLDQKWVLWGSWDTDTRVGGYTYVLIDKKDAAGGNYVFIADGMIDQWEEDKGYTAENGEIIVFCHELGHSIGILKTRGVTELYDPDYYSIMSLMRPENAGQMQGAWYYSSGYWQTKNLEYYTIQ